MKISNDKTKRVALSNPRRAHLKRVTARTSRFGPCFRESALHNTNCRKGESRQNRPNLSVSPVTVSFQAREHEVVQTQTYLPLFVIQMVIIENQEHLIFHHMTRI
jgi:hypothetical protein